MNEIEIFKNKEFGEVRTIIDKNNDVWFIGKEICDKLKYTNVTKTIQDHIDKEDRLNLTNETLMSLGIDLGQRGGWVINESGLYSLILSSKLPSAKEFKHWITKEVIPSIRKNGTYNIQSIPSYQIENPIERAKKWIEEETIRQQQQAQLTEQKPLVEFANHIGKASDCIDMNEFAKMLKKENIENMGRNRLFEWLRTHGILMSNNLPYQRYMEGGYFKVVETIKHIAYGDKLFSKCLVTGKGQIYLVEKIREDTEENNEI